MLSVYTSITSTFHAYIELDTSQRDEQGLIISREITPLRSWNPGIQPVLASTKFEPAWMLKIPCLAFCFRYRHCPPHRHCSVPAYQSSPQQLLHLFLPPDQNQAERLLAPEQEFKSENYFCVSAKGVSYMNYHFL